MRTRRAAGRGEAGSGGGSVGRTRPPGWALALALGGLLLAACEDDPAPPPADGAGGSSPSATPDAAVDAPAPEAGAGDAPTSDGPASGDALASDGAPPTSTITLYEVAAPIADACRRYAEVQCARWKACTPDRFTLDYNSDETCQARREAACRTDFLVVGRGEAAANRMACAAAMMAQSCRDLLFARPLPACASPPGTLTAGQPCQRTSQCARGLNCQVEVDSCGTCQPSIPAGGDCGWWAGGCAPGTTCYDDRCLTTLPAGASCKESSAPCEAGLECLPQGCAEKTAAAGASCAAGDTCDPAQGLYCNFATELCEPSPPAAAVGEVCGTFTPQGGLLACGPDGNCYTASGAIGAVQRCVARADLGQPCDPATGKLCKLPSACARGTCVTPIITQSPTYPSPPCR